MAWYRNFYHCGNCDTSWEDEWSCCCDDECPNCGSRNWSPHESEDLTEVVQETVRGFTVLCSSANADHRPRYRELARFSSRELAMRFVIDGELT